MGGGVVPAGRFCPAASPTATLTEVAIPSPSAVPWPTRSELSAWPTNTRFCVGGATSWAREAKATTATRYFSGNSARKRRAEACATASLVGRRSFAPIEREVSIAITTVASSERTESVACGRAKPSRKLATASSRIATGRCLRQPGTLSTTLGRSAGWTKAAASASRRRWNQT